MASDKKVHMLFKGAVRRRYVLYTDLIACLIIEDYTILNQPPPKWLLEKDTEEISKTIHFFLEIHLNSEMDGSPLVKNRMCIAIAEDIKQHFKFYFP